MLGRTRLQPDTYHAFPLADGVKAGSIRLDAFPDGGISRVRVIGSVEQAARRRAGYRWFNSLPSDQAVTCLVAAGLSGDSAGELIGLRPLQETWLDERPAGTGGRPLQGLTESHLRQLRRLLEGTES
jgi:allantoicase